MEAEASRSLPMPYRQGVSPTALQTQQLAKLRQLREHIVFGPKVPSTNSSSDNANFINFCAGKQLTNGQQIAGGSCNGIGKPLKPCRSSLLIDNALVMGDIPSSGNMISTIITNPGPGSTIPANQDFTVNVQIANLVAGSFTNPDSTYYAAPQALQGGNVVGHTHITIQSLGNNIATTTPPDASKFAFFKGINDAGNGNGALSAAVAGGLPAGVYRVCTMTSASNHQPVTMPVSRKVHLVINFSC
jgi:transcription initiation factor TFIID subunit 15